MFVTGGHDSELAADLSGCGRPSFPKKNRSEGHGWGLGRHVWGLN